MASRPGGPHTASGGATVFDTFPSFPPTKKKEKEKDDCITFNPSVLELSQIDLL